jgi:hypothetical protein
MFMLVDCVDTCCYFFFVGGQLIVKNQVSEHDPPSVHFAVTVIFSQQLHLRAVILSLAFHFSAVSNFAPTAIPSLHGGPFNVTSNRLHVAVPSTKTSCVADNGSGGLMLVILIMHCP